MHRTFSLIAAAAVALSLAGAAGVAPCKDPTTGKFIKCPPATASAPGAAASAAAGGYTLDAKGHCHDSKGKMAKKSMCSGAATATTSTPTGGRRGDPVREHDHNHDQQRQRPALHQGQALRQRVHLRE